MLSVLEWFVNLVGGFLCVCVIQFPVCLVVLCLGGFTVVWLYVGGFC